jgi:hypothetical protein
VTLRIEGWSVYYKAFVDSWKIVAVLRCLLSRRGDESECTGGASRDLLAESDVVSCCAVGTVLFIHKDEMRLFVQELLRERLTWTR